MSKIIMVRIFFFLEFTHLMCGGKIKLDSACNLQAKKKIFKCFFFFGDYHKKGLKLLHKSHISVNSILKLAFASTAGVIVKANYCCQLIDNCQCSSIHTLH